MGYSRGSRGGADKPKLCGICFASFPDAQERKCHYRKYNCRDSGGQLGGLVSTGRCASAKERNLKVEADRKELESSCDDFLTEQDMEMTFMSDLFEFTEGFSGDPITLCFAHHITYGPGDSYISRPIYQAPGLDVADYAAFQNEKVKGTQREFLTTDRKYDAEVLTSVVRTAIVGGGFGSPTFDYTGLGGDGLKYRFDSDDLWSDHSKGLGRFVSAGFTESTKGSLDLKLTLQDVDEMTQALSDEWAEWVYFEEDLEEYLEEYLNSKIALAQEIRALKQKRTVALAQKAYDQAKEKPAVERPISPDTVLQSANSYLSGTKWCYDSEDEDYLPVAPLDKFHNKKHDIDFVDCCDTEYQIQPSGTIYTETWFIDGCLPGCWFKRGVAIDEAVVCEKLPLIGKTPLELMIQYQVEPTGDLLLDIQRALFAYYEKEALPNKKYFNLNGVPTMIVLEDWRCDLRYCLYAPFIQGDQLKHLMVVLNAPLPGWLVDFPKRRKSGVLQASGWNPLRYFSKQATLGFLDGVMTKLKELIGPIINAASFVWDLIIKAKDWAFKALEDMIEKRGEILKALLQPLLYVCGLLLFLGSLKGLKTIVESFGIPLAILTGAAIGLGVYVLVTFLGQAHMGALKRSTKIWDLVQNWDKPSEVKCIDEQIIEVLVEESPDKEEWVRELLASPHYVPECVIDLTHMKDLLSPQKCANFKQAFEVGASEASSPGMLFGS
nr:protease cofactor [Strawberry latent ringspot virus]